jgi:ribosomal protein S18 acetylase RimI-like enzyme
MAHRRTSETQRAGARTIQIADYDARAAPALVETWRASFEHGVGITDPHPLQDQLKFFEEQVVPNNVVRIALRGPAIVGFLASTPQSVSHLYVRVQNIGQGIGSRLLDLAKADSDGSLWLYTFAQNENARRFYERRGFKEVERECENMWKLEAIRYQWQRSERATFSSAHPRGPTPR